jgi:ribosomal peptide maturation radical SAM protein 1
MTDTTLKQQPGTGFHTILPDVLLINMPFGPLLQPSIGLGLLKAGLTYRGINSKILYFTLKFAELIGVSVYETISNGHPAIYDLLGEWIFSSALFSSTNTDVEAYINDVLRGHSPAHREAHKDWTKPVPEQFIQDVLAIRNQVETFLDECLDEVINYNPSIVAFTSTFQQHLAALSLAKRLKARARETFIILGGANCEGVMGAEVIRQFAFVDATISGEGDSVFPELVQRVLEQKSIDDLQGVFTRENNESLFLEGKYPNAPLVSNMDALPFPDYDDFFQQLKTGLGVGKNLKPQLLFESSRGCWWGEKNQCTFCGLNGNSMAYRSKSAERSLNELLHLVSKYPNCSVRVVDNILDMKYFQDFIPELAARQLDIGLFYEVKANLRKEQVRMLRDAGIEGIQPGIESLSSHVLSLMRKGVTGIQNIQLLKWCKEFGVHPSWYLLWGFPKELPEEYAQMAKMIPLLTHLQPPEAGVNIRLDRFSPHLEQAEHYGFVNIKPYPSYHYIYPFDTEVVNKLAYFFTFEYSQPQDVASYTLSVAEQVALWQEVHHKSDLFCVDKGTKLLIFDYRDIASKPVESISGIERIIYLACDRIQTTKQLQHLIKKHFNQELTTQETEEILQKLVNYNLMIKEGNKYLSLAIPLGEYSPSNQHILEQFLTTNYSL